MHAHTLRFIPCIVHFIFLLSSHPMEWYQNEDWVTARITKKTKFDFPPSKVQIKFEEKHCAVIIAGKLLHDIRMHAYKAFWF